MRLPAVLVLALTMAASSGAVAQKPQTFGAGVSLDDATPLSKVLDRPADFEGKTLRLDGTVTAVCTHMGCWMSFAATPAKDGRTLLIKVDDGVIVFPVSAKGHRASAQGVLQRVGSSAEAREAASEHAAQSGSDVAAAWQLKATGAVVY